MTRGPLTGCVPDLLDGSELSFRDHPLAAEPPIVSSENPDLRMFMPEVRLQLAENCCAQAVRDAAYGVARAAGTPIAEPSQAFLYALTRLSSAPNMPLIDAGSSLRDMFRSLADRAVVVSAIVGADLGGAGEGWGLIPDVMWPEDPTTTNTIPPDDCFREGEYATVTNFYAIPDGASSADAMIAALRRLRFPTVAFIVDEKYAQIGDGVYDTPGGKVIGSHCQLAVAYSKALDAFLLRNSWGLDFGDLGYAWVSRSFVNRQTYGKWVLDVAPARLGA